MKFDDAGRVLCEFCDQEIRDPNGPGVYRKVVGWVQSRKAGGANAVAMPSAALAVAHKMCFEVHRLHLEAAPPRQSLF